MTDLTAELDALPKMPEVEDYCTPSLDKQADAGHYHYAAIQALEGRLALAERLLVRFTGGGRRLSIVEAINDARAYLSFREKERGR